MSALLPNLLLFPRVLRRAGLAVSLDQSLAFLRALALVDLGTREEVYHAARSLLVTRRGDLRTFDEVFRSFFDRGGKPPPGRPRKAPVAPRHDPRGFTVATYLAARAGRDDPELEIADRTGTASELELLRHKEFSAMSPDELEAVKRLIRGLRWRASLRRTRRRVADRRGPQVDPRRTMRGLVQYGGVPLRLERRRRKVKERPVVLLADVSGSMETISRLVLLFFYGVSHSLREVESFVFGTRLSRVTPQLELKNVDRAIDEASRQVLDWAGGTRIGDSLGEFNRRWSRRVLRRGAIVLLVSDGWERGDVDALRREMRYLQHRCHRLIWLNPLAGRATYEPRARGMAAAMPYVDDFLPIHNLRSLEQLAARLGTLPDRATRNLDRDKAHDSATVR